MNTNQPKKKVYLITNNNSGDIIENELKKMEFIGEIRKGSPNILNELTESFLSLFDCFIYDFCDSGFDVQIQKRKEIELYIKNDGGSFLVTHDQWDQWDRKSNDMLDLIGLEYDENFYKGKWEITNKARICLQHELFNSYNNLSSIGNFDIAYTHQTLHKIIENKDNKARSIMELVLDKPSNIKHDYLVVNEPGKGRIAYWAAGHSHTISEDEKKLFKNIIAWLTKYKK